MTITDLALTRFGCPYIWGAKGPDRFDCSGLVMWALAAGGGPDWRETHNCARLIQECIRAEIPAPGDFVFYGLYGQPSHVMLWMGGSVFGACGGGPQTLTPMPSAYVRWRPSVDYRSDALGIYRLRPA